MKTQENKRISGFASTIALCLACIIGTHNSVLGGPVSELPNPPDCCGNKSGGSPANSTGGNSSSSSSSPGASTGKSVGPVGGSVAGCKGTCGASGNGSPSTGGSGSGCGCPSGMAIWEVSEPHINVWLYDEPLGYQPGLGSRVSFKLSYKQRDSRQVYTGVSGNYTGVGPNWSCSWGSYLYRSFTITTNTDWVCDPPDYTNCYNLETYTTNYDGTATVVMSDGGQRTFTPDGIATEFFSHGTMAVNAYNGDGSWNSITITYPDGSKEDYSTVTPSVLKIGDSEILYRTATYDPFGNATRFYYNNSSSPLLQYVVDTDGRTNTLSYTGSLITSVQDPFGRTATLQYQSGVLTNIIDPEGISSSFSYDSGGLVTNLHTPYGDTKFEYVDNGFGNATVIRAVRVIDTVGGTNVYMLAQDSYVGGIPVPSISDAISAYPCVDWQRYRNSFYWGPRQSQALPVDLNSIQYSDFTSARIRHWLHGNSFSDLSQILGMEVEPSPDGVNYGQATFYGYDDSPACYLTGPNSLPSLIAKGLPDGTNRYTWYQRDSLGRATNVVDTYSSSFGASPSLRTNVYVYNGADLVAHYGPFGNLEDGYAYNSKHQLTYYTNAVGDVTSYTYDSAGRLTSTITPAGLTTTNIYFASGAYTNFIQQTIDLEISRTNSYTWQNDLVYAHTDERGLTVTNIYDNLQRATNVLDARGKIVYTYDKLDLVKVVDRMGFTNSYTYDGVRRQTSQTDAQSRTTYFNYCTCGALESIQDAANNYRYFFYDNAGRMTNVVYEDNYSVTNFYDSLGELLYTIDSAGIAVTNWYNNQGLRYTTWNAAGQISSIQFDIQDRPVYVTDANNVTITNTYDAVGRLLTRGYPDGGVEKFGYSPRGLVAYTNQLNYTNFYAYDAAMRKTFETNANGEVLRYTNNAAGDLLSLTDGKLQTTQWKYDEFGRVTNKLDQAGAEIFRYKYDLLNRLTNRWTPAMGTTTYKYDRVGNLTNVVYPSGTTSVVLKYDALNRVTNMVDGVGTTIYSYSAAGQLLTEDGPFANDTVTNTYWNRMRVGMDLQQPTGVWTNQFTYDLARRLYSVASPAGEFDYQYRDSLPSTLVQKLTQPTGAYITNVYDNNARLLGTYLYTSADVLTNRHEYVYNAGNQRTQQTFRDSSTAGYTYDKIGQLKVSNSSINSEDRGYAYDAAWNLSSRTNNGSSQQFTVDNKNELTGTSFGPSIGYDANGNLIWESSVGTFTRNYDAENRLVQAYYGGGSGGGTPPPNYYQFVYDGLGRLRKNQYYTFDYVNHVYVFQGETRYIYDGWRVIQERDSGNTPTVSYTRGSDLSGSMEGAGGIGGLLARSTGYASGWNSHAFYHADGNGNITYMLNGSQSMVASYKYDPFGNTLSSSGTLASANVYRFSSKERMPVSDIYGSELYYYGYRFYEPALQRWLNRDPIEERGGINLYLYVGNHPVSRFDSFGLHWHSTPGGGGYLDPEDYNPKPKGPKGPPYDPSQWPSPDDNCLAYALNRPGVGTLLPGGDQCGGTDCASLKASLKKNYGAKDTGFFGGCPCGYRKIKVYQGYHFQRQDADGTWSEKNLGHDARKCKMGICGPVDDPEDPGQKPANSCGYICVPN